MAKAVEEIGGTSKLTEREIQRVGQTMTDTLMRCGRRAVSIPANMQKLADATKNANKAGVDISARSKD